jgi:hypothetical protein
MTDQTSPNNDPAPVPAPPKRRLPTWGWIAIAAGAVVLVIFGVLTMALLAAGGDTADRAETASTATPSASSPPSASATPSSEATRTQGTTSPSDTAEPAPGSSGEQSTGDVSLDDAFVLGTTGPAIWSVPVVAGWDFTDPGMQGASLLVNADTGCIFTTSQILQPATDPTATSDRAATEAGVQQIKESFLAQAPETVVTDSPSVTVPYGDPSGSGDTVEFASFRGDYVRADNGEAWSSLYVVRAMPQLDGLLYTAMSCATATIDADKSIWTGMLERTVVIAGE